MFKNTVSLSQPLNSRSYNEYNAQKMQNTKGNSAMPTQGAMEQTQGGNLLDEMGFASELRSQKTVSALMNLNHPKSPFPPTLAERGALIDATGNITMPASDDTQSVQTNGNAQANANNSPSTVNSTPSVPANQATQNTTRQKVTLIEEDRIGIPMNGRSKHGSPAASSNSTLLPNGMRVFALDNRSLGVLSRISEKKENIPLTDASMQSMMNKNHQTTKVNKNQESTKSINTNKIDENSAEIGQLAAQYESSTKGSSAIGYDRNGGTSYGTYQISSRAGTFKEFLSFLDKEAPEWANQLRDAGDANTGSRHGAVPSKWKELSTENPDKMADLEHNFIMKSHYEPVASYVEEKWQGKLSHALQEVIFSTAVQHGVGGAKQVFSQALADTPNINAKSLTNSANTNMNPKQDGVVSFLMSAISHNPRVNNTNNPTVEKDNNVASLQAQEELIRNVYSHRSTKFGSSTLQVQEAAKNRFAHEQKEALSILT